MNNLLSRLLTKRKITKEELSEEEKKDFERWENILSGEISVEKISEFCKAQKDIIENQWKDFGNEPMKNERLIIAHTIYSTIIKTINSPEVERKSLENYLNELIK